MLRSFCVGAMVGFFFGSSKKGKDVRDGIDGFLTELTSSDAMKVLDEKKDEITEMASKQIDKISGTIENTLKNLDPLGRKAEEKESDEFADKDEFEGAENFEPAMNDANAVLADAKPLDVDKAQELADKLGAKPSAPEDENIAAFHPEDERRSA